MLEESTNNSLRRTQIREDFGSDSMSELSAKNSLRNQIREDYGSLFYTYKAHLKQYERLERKSKKFKYAQIIFSVLATAGIVSSIFINEIIIVGIGAVFSAMLLAINLYYKDFDLVSEMLLHRKVADELWLIKGKYISLLTDFNALDSSLIRSRRDELQNNLYELYKHTPKIDSKSHKLAQSAIQKKEKHFFSVEELDKLFPSHLRFHVDNKDDKTPKRKVSV